MTVIQCWAAVIFWGGLAFCAYIYAGFFALLAVWAKVFGKSPIPGDDHTPAVSLLISAYNEERVIARKVENALAQDYPKDKFEVCLVSDGSSDRTVDVAAGWACPHLKLIPFAERRGKNAALNDAIPQTFGDVLVFTDANTLYETDAVRNLARHFADPKVGLVVGSLHFLSDEGEQVDGGLYWRQENRLKQLQSALRSVLVANGSIFAVRRELMGTLHNDVANDFQTPMEVGGQGFDILYEPEAVALEKSASDPGEEFARKVRIVTRGMTGTARLVRHIRGKRLFLFVSHKLLRWLAGYVQILILAANAVLVPLHPVYAAAMACQGFCYALAAVGWLAPPRIANHKVFQVPFYLCMVNLAGILASLKFLTGRKVAMWEKAETAR